MQTIGRLFMRIDLSVKGKKLEELASDVYNAVNSAIDEFSDDIPISNFGETVRVREGSVEIVAIIFVGLLKYKDISESLRALIKDVRDIVKCIREKIKKLKQLKHAQVQSSRITTGHLTQFNRIYRMVELGEISHEEAKEEAIRFFERAGASEEIINNISNEIKQFFQSIPVQHRPVKQKPRPAAPHRPYRRRRTYGPGIEIIRKPGETEATWTLLQ